MLGLLIGGTLRFVGRVSGVGAALVGALISALGWVLTVMLALAGIAAKELEMAFFPTLQSLLAETPEVMRFYFEASPLQYLALLAATAGGFIGANSVVKMRKRY